MVNTGMAAGDAGRLRASDRDRNAVNEVLTTAFAEGRLTKDEYDERVGQLYAARTYGELDALTADLPTAMPAVPVQRPLAPPDRGTNGLAVASLVCGLCQFFVPPVTTLLAIGLGHAARGQIRRNGQAGSGLATAGLVLGWLGLALGLLIIMFVVVGVASHPSGAHIQIHP